MNLYIFPIRGRLVVAADCHETAAEIADAIRSSMQFELNSTLGRDNTSGLAGQVALGNPAEMAMNERTLEKVTSQASIPME